MLPALAVAALNLAFVDEVGSGVAMAGKNNAAVISKLYNIACADVEYEAPRDSARVERNFEEIVGVAPARERVKIEKNNSKHGKDISISDGVILWLIRHTLLLLC